MTTLVIGARGAVGRNVLQQLRTAGEPVRASVRDLAKAGDLPPGVDVVEADLTQPQTLKAAFAGVRQIFAYAEGTPALAEAARSAGVEHVVLMSSGSVLLPWTGGNAIAQEHREAEEVLAASGLRCTPIRPLVLAGNALYWSHSIRRDGTVAIACPDKVTAPVHERDIAALAVAALTGRGGDDVSDLLTGPDLLTQREQADLIGKAIGRPLRIDELSFAEARERFSRFMPVEEAEAIIQFLEHDDAYVTEVAERVLGRPAVPFGQWAVEHAGDFA